MVTLERNGVRVEAETIRKAERALKAEEARRSAARAEAVVRAYCNLGRIAAAAEGAGPIPGHSLSDIERARHVTSDGSSVTIRVRDEQWREAKVGFYAHRVTDLRLWASDEVCMVQVETRDGEVEVYAVGAWDGETACVLVPGYVIAEAVRS